MKADTIERVIGYVLKDEVQHNLFEGQGEHTRAEIKLPIQVVYQDRPLPKLFTRLPATNGHIVLLIDECGGTADIVSMVYIVETLLGLEITDEFDVVEDVQKLARER